MNAARVEALFATQEPAGLGSEPRSGVWTLDEAMAKAGGFCAEKRIQGVTGECLKGLVLLWHDHLDAGHERVQDLSGPDAAWVHGIMHRREPDYSNARYWFHRVGMHPGRGAMAEASAVLLAEHAALPFRLIREGHWDPLVFIDAVAAAGRQGAGASDAGLMRALQREEFLVLARRFAGE